MTRFRCPSTLASSLLLCAGAMAQTSAPHIDRATGQFLFNGQPNLLLAGELSNSASGTATQADTILPELAAEHLNTVLVPVAWEQIEPTEGHFDFSILDHWIAVARANHLHLVPLWFGSWKNSTSGYAPGWVKSDTVRFPRATTMDGALPETLTPIALETLRCDSRAFGVLLDHLRATDAKQQTVILIQVENEVGLLNDSRDRSSVAGKLFHEPVPSTLNAYLTSHSNELSPELIAVFNSRGHNWPETFGVRAGEVFMAWQYATFINTVAVAGKARYNLPMYVNAQLPAPFERAGEYPSGGPHPYFLAVYRAAAPALDMFSPDIYWPDFERWIDRYAAVPGNPVFVPEARLEAAPYNAIYAFGAAHAFGFSPFNIDSLKPDDNPLIAQVYAHLSSLADILPTAQHENRTTAVVLHKDSSRPTQSVPLGGYLFHTTLARSWPTQALATEDGAALILQTAPGDFLILGSGLHVTFSTDPDVAPGTAGILSIDEVTRSDGKLNLLRHLNGDETNQNRTLLMNPKQFRLYHVRLTTTPQT